MHYFFVIVAVLVVLNFFFLFKRSKKNRDVGKRATEDRKATVKAHGDLVRRLKYEQYDAARRIELRNKTFELYDQVRREHESENEAQATNADEAVDEAQAVSAGNAVEPDRISPT